MSTEYERPRPAYGEYATPEQVARARGMTLEEYERHLAASARPDRVEERADATSAPLAQVRVAQPAPAAVSPGDAQRGTGNRIATIALLVFGFLSMLLSLPGLLGLGDGFAEAFAVQGLPEFTSFDTARAFGVTAVVVQLLLWLAALSLSVSALKRGRLAWWIPLVFGVIAVLVVSALVVSAILVDPAFLEYVDSISAP